MVVGSTPRQLSEMAEVLLIGLCDESATDTGSLDARVWADAIAELLDLGLVELRGTLSKAEIVATEKGQQQAKKLLAPGVGS